jgi:Na+-translocating ferredoxin:NAD+ oxidoreductase subunit B
MAEPRVAEKPATHSPDAAVDAATLDRDAARIDALANAIDRALPQTQCTRCGYPDCRSYAEAIASSAAAINRCPPGGAQGIARLAAITGDAVVPLDASHGTEGPRLLAVIDEAGCIGCTLCLKACPVDCIVGGPKAMHVVIDALCTGCELCLPACPVDCISLVNQTGSRTGWAAWSSAQADEADARYDFHQFRLQRERTERDARMEARALTLKPADTIAAPHDSDRDSDSRGDRQLGDAERRRAAIASATARARSARTPR